MAIGFNQYLLIISPEHVNLDKSKLKIFISLKFKF